MIMYLKFSKAEEPTVYLTDKLNRTVTLNKINKHYFEVVENDTVIGTLEKTQDNFIYNGY